MKAIARRILLVLVVVLVLSVVAFAATRAKYIPPQPAGDRAGRFVVLPARLDNEDNLVRVDTFTGQTWTLIRVPTTVNGQRGHVRGWHPVDEDPWEDVRQAATPPPQPLATQFLDEDPTLKAAGLIK